MSSQRRRAVQGVTRCYRLLLHRDAPPAAISVVRDDETVGTKRQSSSETVASFITGKWNQLISGKVHARRRLPMGSSQPICQNSRYWRTETRPSLNQKMSQNPEWHGKFNQHRFQAQGLQKSMWGRLGEGDAPSPTLLSFPQNGIRPLKHTYAHP